jgi:hypothetical protein
MRTITLKNERSIIEQRYRRFLRRYRLGFTFSPIENKNYRSPSFFIKGIINEQWDIVKGEADYPVWKFLEDRYPDYQFITDTGYDEHITNRIKNNIHLIYLMHYCAVDDSEHFAYYTL